MDIRIKTIKSTGVKQTFNYFVNKRTGFKMICLRVIHYVDSIAAPMTVKFHII